MQGVGWGCELGGVLGRSLSGGGREGIEEGLEAVEVGLEAGFGVFVGVVEDADGSDPAGVADGLEELGVEFALADDEDFLAAGLAVAGHAVEVEREEVGFHLGEQGGEAVEVVVAVMEVVDQADVVEALGAEGFDQGDLVFRLAEPAAVVVEGDGGALGLGGLDDGAEAFEFGGDAGGLLLGGLGRLAAAGDPELGCEAAGLEAVEEEAGVVVEGGGEPDGGQLDPVAGQGVQLAVEGGQVFGAPVVGEAADAEAREHGGAVLGGTLLGVEGDDAPGDEVGRVEEAVVRGWGWAERGGKGGGEGEDEGGSGEAGLGHGGRLPAESFGEEHAGLWPAGAAEGRGPG